MASRSGLGDAEVLPDFNLIRSSLLYHDLILVDRFCKPMHRSFLCQRG